MKKEGIYLIFLTSITFSILLISNVFAYSWSPSANCYNIGHSGTDLNLPGSVGGAYCTDLTMHVKYPGATSYTILSSESTTCRDWWDQRCNENRINRITTSFEIHWSSIDNICINSRLEGDYSFKLLSREQPRVPQAYCILNPPLNVKWDLYDSWCTDCGYGDWKSDIDNADGWVSNISEESKTLNCIVANIAGDCPGSNCPDYCVEISDNFCCSPITMSSNFSLTNEDCGFLDVETKDTLCYFPRKAKNLNPGFDGEWLNSSEFVGQVVYLGCANNENTNRHDGPEFVSAGDEWKICYDEHWKFEVTAKDLNDDEQTHEYICVDWVAPRMFSIAECNPHDRNERLNWNPNYIGGIDVRGGQSVNVTGNDVYFCTNQSTWSTDLDFYELAGNRGEFCNNARFPPSNINGYGGSLSGTPLRSQNQQTRWTGGYCCGESDDWHNSYPDLSYSVLNEYYSDNSPSYPTDYPGACFNNWYQPNDRFLTIYDENNRGIRLEEVLVVDSTFQGCAIDHTKAMPSDVVCSTSRTNDVNKPYEGTTKGIPALNVFNTEFGTSINSNDFLLKLRDKPNMPQSYNRNSGQLLVNDNKYCSVINWSNGQSFFCSYLEKWSAHDPSSPRTHLSFIPWINETAQQAECCRPSECWDGEQCIPSAKDTLSIVPYKVMNDRGDGFICKDGAWEWIYSKTTWDGSEHGYCLHNDQCLVFRGGDRSLNNVYSPNYYPTDVIGVTNMPLCINDGEHYLDHYCEDGTWTSRTKYVALELYNLAEGNDFVLYCDNYKKVLNNVAYILDGDFSSIEQKYFMLNPASGCQSYSGENVPCANNVCVLVNNPQSNNPVVHVGTSINSRLNRTTSSDGRASAIYDIGLAFGTSLSNCERYERGDDSFVECGDNLYYNGAKNIVIFTRSTGPSNIDYVDVLNNLFTGFIRTIVGWLTGNIGGDIAGYDFNVLDQMADDLFNELGESYNIPYFECLNCTDSVSVNNPGNVCGIRGNPRKVYGLSSLYLSKSGSKSIFGISEYQAPYGEFTPSRYNAIFYNGFSEDICASFDNVMGYRCQNVDNGYLVSTMVTSPGLEISYHSLFDIFPGENWVFIAPSTRIHSR
jgi:hypothetical protein